MIILFQSWLVFDELSKPFFTEGDSVGFSNTKPPKDKDNNAYCQVSERRKTPMRYKKEIEIHCVLCYTNKRKESLENLKKKNLKTDLRAVEILFLSQLFLTVKTIPRL